jgi:hypothetical protein
MLRCLFERAGEDQSHNRTQNAPALPVPILYQRQEEKEEVEREHSINLTRWSFNRLSVSPPSSPNVARAIFRLHAHPFQHFYPTSLYR